MRASLCRPARLPAWTRGAPRSRSAPRRRSPSSRAPTRTRCSTRLREREPVSWLPALDGWLVTRRDLALAVMRDAETFTVDDPRFSTAQVVGPSMLSLDGAEHERHRDPFARPFRLDAGARALHGARRGRVRRAARRDRRTGRPIFGATLAGPLSVAAMVAALGLDDHPAEVRSAGTRAIVARRDGHHRRARAGRRRARTAFAALAACARAGARPRAGRRRSSARGGRRAGALEPRARSSRTRPSCCSAGSRRPTAMIANALPARPLERRGTRGARARAGAAANAVEESLRLEPAAAVVDRYATRDVELGGARIGRRELVRVSLAGANRDPAVFADPHRFDVRPCEREAAGGVRARPARLPRDAPRAARGPGRARAGARAAARPPARPAPPSARRRASSSASRRRCACRWSASAGGTVTAMTDALIVDAVRTPIGRRNGALAGVRADELAAQVLNGLVARVDLDPGEIEDVQMGCVTQVGEQALNVARMSRARRGLAGDGVRRRRSTGSAARRCRRRSTPPRRSRQGTSTSSSPRASSRCRACRWDRTSAANGFGGLQRRSSTSAGRSCRRASPPR